MEMRRLDIGKRGQNLTLGTLILIILGIAVLVFLIFGFSVGWNNMFDRITQFGGSSNVDTIKQACSIACSTNSQAAFCDEERTVKFGDDRDDLERRTCNSLVNVQGVNVDACQTISC